MPIWCRYKVKIKVANHKLLTNILTASTELDYVQFFRYLFVGGIAALIDWFFYWFLISILELYYILAALISFIMATSANYFLSVKWVFLGRRYSRVSELSLVFIVSAIGLLFNQLSLVFFIEIISIHFMVAKIMATGLVFIWNFVLRKYYIFNH